MVNYLVMLAPWGHLEHKILMARLGWWAQHTEQHLFRVAVENQVVCVVALVEEVGEDVDLTVLAAMSLIAAANIVSDLHRLRGSGGGRSYVEIADQVGCCLWERHGRHPQPHTRRLGLTGSVIDSSVFAPDLRVSRGRTARADKHVQHGGIPSPWWCP